MKLWKVYRARGSALELEKKLNVAERDGFTIFSVGGPAEVIHGGFPNWLWTIAAYKEQQCAAERMGKQ